MKNKKILFVASITGHITAFHIPYLKWFKENGYDVHVAAAKTKELPSFIDKYYDISFERSPFSLKHFKVYRELKKIISKGDYTLISCHTPMASVLTRLASRHQRKVKEVKVVYMAHGFHFYKKAPLLNWITYFPIEIILTRFTDGLICINKEDYDLIVRKGSNKCCYYLVPGVGVESTKFSPISVVEKNIQRAKKEIDTDKFIVIYAAEFIHRKNHKFIIDSFVNHKDKIDNILCLFAGHGTLEEDMKSLVREYRLENSIKFLGFRNDINELFQVSDLGISSSFQEGLPINIVEEMLCGLPILASIERGHNELVEDGVNGFLFDLQDHSDFINKLNLIKNNELLWDSFSKASREKGEEFALDKSLIALTDVYRNFL